MLFTRSTNDANKRFAYPGVLRGPGMRGRCNFEAWHTQAFRTKLSRQTDMMIDALLDQLLNELLDIAVEYALESTVLVASVVSIAVYFVHKYLFAED